MPGRFHFQASAEKPRRKKDKEGAQMEGLQRFPKGRMFIKVLDQPPSRAQRLAADTSDEMLGDFKHMKAVCVFLMHLRVQSEALQDGRVLLQHCGQLCQRQ